MALMLSLEMHCVNTKQGICQRLTSYHRDIGSSNSFWAFPEQFMAYKTIKSRDLALDKEH